MANLMEKDALIEKLATTCAFLGRQIPFEHLATSDDVFAIKNLRFQVINSEPEDLDFNTVVKQCDEIMLRHGY